MFKGEWLAELRKDLGKTQKEMAAELHISARSYGDYERGTTEPPDEIKIQMAKYFNVSLDYLLGLIDRPRPLHEDNRYIRLPYRLSDAAHQQLLAYIRFLHTQDK